MTILSGPAPVVGPSTLPCTFPTCEQCDSVIFGSVLRIDSFLATIPALVLLVLLPARLYRLYGKERRLLPLRELPWTGILLLASRVGLTCGLLAANVALWATLTAHLSQWSNWLANATQTIASLVIIPVVLLEHLRNGRPSQPPALYLLVNTLFLAARARTIALIGLSLPAMYATLSLNALLFISLQLSSRTSLKNGSSLPPAATSGLVGRYLIAWVLPMLWRGYKKPLDMDTLGEIDNSLHSKACWDTLSPYWTKQRARHVEGKTKQPLPFAALLAFRGRLMAPIIPYFIASWASMGRPLIINQTINFVNSYSTSEPDDLSNGWGLVAASALIYIAYAVSTAMAELATQASATALRGALMEAIFRKSLVIQVESAREMGAAKASNLMSVDVNSIVQTVRAIHQVWTAVLMTGIAMYIIYTQIGLSFIAPVVGAIVFFAILPPLAKGVPGTRKRWASSTDKRVKFMSSVFRHIKAVKMSAYESCVKSLAIALRYDEVEACRSWIREILKVSILTNVLSNVLSLSTIITFTIVSIYTSSAGSVNTATIFTVTSTITLISEPLLMMGQQLGSILSAWASLKRIEEFLLYEEREEPIQTVEEGRIEMVNATFGIKNKATLLQDINISVEKPPLWIIAGRVGSGKSTLLQAVLGELDTLNGRSSVNLGAIGYCAQDPWLTASNSIRKNITFMHPFEAAWYDKVIKAVNLEVDLRILKDGDSTAVSSLSGGQRQRWVKTLGYC